MNTNHETIRRSLSASARRRCTACWREDRVASFPLADVEASRPGLSLELPLCEDIDERAMQRPVHGDPARVTGPPARGFSVRSGHPLKRQERPVVSPANTPRRKKDSPARREPSRHLLQEVDPCLAVGYETVHVVGEENAVIRAGRFAM